MQERVRNEDADIEFIMHTAIMPPQQTALINTNSRVNVFINTQIGGGHGCVTLL